MEAAYDVLLLQSLSRRRAGVVADAGVRFADTPKPRPSPPPAPSGALSLLTKALPAVDRSVGGDKQALAGLAGVFAVAALWVALAGGPLPPNLPDAPPGAPLALATAAAVYALRRKRVPLPRSLGLAAAGLAVGALLGAALEAGLRVDIVALGPFGSPAAVVAEGALTGTLAAAALLV